MLELAPSFLYSLAKDGFAVIRRIRQRLSPPDVVQPNMKVSEAIGLNRASRPLRYLAARCYSERRQNRTRGHRKVIDLECDLPPDENGNPRKLEVATRPPRYGGIPSREGWLSSRVPNEFAADSALEETRFEPSVLLI
jgi:hypothetical protein